MALCMGSNGCGCALTSTSLVLTGSGAPGDPWVIEGASPSRMTNTERLALTGGDLWDGRQVWTTDSNVLWMYNGAAWESLSNPRILTDAERLALAGSNLFEGLQVWTTDTNVEWIHDGALWQPMTSNDAGCRLSATGTDSASAVSTISWTAADWDPPGFVSVPDTTLSVPTGYNGMYVLSVMVGAVTGSYDPGSLVVVTLGGGGVSGGNGSPVPSGKPSTAIPHWTSLVYLPVGATVSAAIDNESLTTHQFGARLHMSRVAWGVSV